jgi:hypothetical protein
MTSFSGTLIRAGNNAKTLKSDKASNYTTAIMYLAPADLAGGKTVCAFADLAGCKAGCLNTAGQGIYSNVQNARIAKTRRYQSNVESFMADLAIDVRKFVAFCERESRQPAIRLNGTSDILFERIPVAGSANIMSAFPMVQFYDYTKIATRAYAKLPGNYHLTLSYSNANPRFADMTIKAALDTGINLAVVYRSQAFRDSLISSGSSAIALDRPVIDGDETDLRFLDPRESIVGLYAKGKAKKDSSGFVID